MSMANYSSVDGQVTEPTGDATMSLASRWPAPVASGRVNAVVRIPGSKSLTNRELVLAAIASEPTVLRGVLLARDSALMMQALRALGVGIEERTESGEPVITVTPPREFIGGADIDCGLAGTVMRFVPVLASLARGDVTFDGDAGARRRPMSGTLAALRQLGVRVTPDEFDRLPFTVSGTGTVRGGDISIDASASSQFVSGLLLAAPRFEQGLTLRHVGEGLPSLPHIEMTMASLRARGVSATTIDEHTWRVEPGQVSGGEVTIEPDLSNAAPFLIAAIVAGGTVRIPDWPEATTQVGDHLRSLLAPFGAEFTREGSTLVCHVRRGLREGMRLAPQQLDLGHAGELAPNIAALLALGDGTSTITGIAHLRGHETDRIQALANELERVGCGVEQLADGLRITPRERHGADWRCYEDHRMATSGAIVGLVTEGVELDDVASTSKTLPNFPRMWSQLLGTANDHPDADTSRTPADSPTPAATPLTTAADADETRQ